MKLTKSVLFISAFLLISAAEMGLAAEPAKLASNEKTSGCFSRQELSSKTTGILQAIYVKEGQMVTAGQILTELDGRLLRAGLKEAKSALLNAEAIQKLAQDTVTRFKKLKKGQSISEQQLVESEIKLEQAKAGTMQAQATVERLQAQVDDTAIKAEVSGKVKGLPTVLGMQVQTGQSLGRIEIDNPKCS